MTPYLEVEVKFLVEDLAVIRERVLAAGAELRRPRLFERNLRFDDDAGTLRQKERLLRLRQDNAVRLTFKGALQHEAGAAAKIHEELEIKVDDFDAAVALLQRLGFQPRQTYEKYRETFYLDGVEILLDELPFGNFVELEGAVEALQNVARRLELDWEERILDNYLAIMAGLKEHYQLPFDDCTFTNFADLDISVSARSDS